MTEWSNLLPLTARFFSHVLRFESVSVYIREKVASDLGLGGGFPFLFRFPRPLTCTTGLSRLSRDIIEQCHTSKLPDYVYTHGSHANIYSGNLRPSTKLFSFNLKRF